MQTFDSFPTTATPHTAPAANTAPRTPRQTLEHHRALLAPIAVYDGTIQQPAVTFFIHPDVTPTQREKITGLPGLSWRRSVTFEHPTHGTLRGGWCTRTAPEWGLLDQALPFAYGPVADIDPRQLRYPLITTGPRPGTLRIWPRLAGRALIQPHLDGLATWDADTHTWVAPSSAILDAAGRPPQDFILDTTATPDTTTPDTPPATHTTPSQGTLPHTATAITTATPDGLDPHTIASVAAAVTPDDAPDAYPALLDHVGDIPDWFGMDLRPYQRTAALALAAGTRLLGDEPGTGKTVMSLAAAALLGTERIIVAAPGVALTHWDHEARKTRLIDHMGDGAQIVTIVAGRKQKELPKRGIVITTPSLLRSRDALRESIEQWAPDLLIYDEAHSAKTWESQTSTAMRSVAKHASASFALTGTPMFASPEEIAPLLDITGKLDPLFGGYEQFRARFMYQISFQVEAKGRGGRTYTRTVKKWVPRKSTIDELRDVLDTHCWIRRTKAQVQAEMPPKVRFPRIVDIKPSALVDAHQKVIATIDEWLTEHEKHTGHLPGPDEITEYARENLGLSSPLREATGIAKIPAAIEHLTEWKNSSGQNPDGTWVRPLIVWVHHHVVMDALSEALTEHDIPFTKITGGMQPARIGEVAAEFQEGQWPFILCSIRAAGTGITLTRATDELFVETDWTNALISQAESRAHRHGQDQRVMIETMIAPGTLDVSIQAVLRKKAEFLRATTPTADVDVAVLGPREKLDSPTPQIEKIKDPSDIIRALVEEAIAMRASGTKRPRKAPTKKKPAAKKKTAGAK